MFHQILCGMTYSESGSGRKRVPVRLPGTSCAHEYMHLLLKGFELGPHDEFLQADERRAQRVFNE